MLDELGPIEPRDVHRMPQMMVDLTLGDDGYLEINMLGEETEHWIMERWYPVLNEAFRQDGNIGEAVKQERARLEDTCELDLVEGERERAVQKATGSSSAYMRAIARAAGRRQKAAAK